MSGSVDRQSHRKLYDKYDGLCTHEEPTVSDLRGLHRGGDHCDRGMCGPGRGNGLCTGAEA